MGRVWALKVPEKVRRPNGYVSEKQGDNNGRGLSGEYFEIVGQGMKLSLFPPPPPWWWQWRCSKALFPLSHVFLCTSHPAPPSLPFSPSPPPFPNVNRSCD